MRAFPIVFVLCLLATTAAAQEAPDVTVRGYSAVRWQGTSSAVTLATDPITAAGAASEYRVLSVGLPGPFPVLDVMTELGFEKGSTEGTTFDQLENRIGTWQLTAGARARLPIFSWLHLDARAALGGARTKVRIADRSRPSMAIRDKGTSMVMSTGLALALMPRLTSRSQSAFHMGIEVELGYQESTAVEVRAYPEDRPPEELTIPAQYASLGDLDLDGWTLRIGATIGF